MLYIVIDTAALLAHSEQHSEALAAILQFLASMTEAGDLVAEYQDMFTMTGKQQKIKRANG